FGLNLGICVYGGKLNFGGSALLPLNAALCDRAKFLGFFTFVVSGYSFFGVGNQHCRLKFLNHLSCKTCQSS
ncbi:hypothetical protein, partial [Vibrio parahaemolyticus]|uniref:hypothetical protein n=1 Tax=Vibrio parahaemolyticus TaxID=670 RepID=UPI001E47F21E